MAYYVADGNNIVDGIDQDTSYPVTFTRFGGKGFCHQYLGADFRLAQQDLKLWYGQATKTGDIAIQKAIKLSTGKDEPAYACKDCRV